MIDTEHINFNILGFSVALKKEYTCDNGCGNAHHLMADCLNPPVDLPRKIESEWVLY